LLAHYAKGTLFFTQLLFSFFISCFFSFTPFLQGTFQRSLTVLFLYQSEQYGLGLDDGSPTKSSEKINKTLLTQKI